MLIIPAQMEERLLRIHESNSSILDTAQVMPSPTAVANRSTSTLVDTPRVFKLSDVQVIAELGSGASGTVYKIQDKVTSAFLAMKVIHKKGLAYTQIEDIVDEQVALQKMAGEIGFLQLEASFHDSENFYLATVGRLCSPSRID
jgi:Protein kinase domain.